MRPQAQQLDSDMDHRDPPDGSVLWPNNPFAGSRARAQIWMLGHCNAAGVRLRPPGAALGGGARHAPGQRPNLIEKAKNYGWPTQGPGRHRRPRHPDRPLLDVTRGDETPVDHWDPAHRLGCSGTWATRSRPGKGESFIGALKEMRLVRLEIQNGARDRRGSTCPPTIPAPGSASATCGRARTRVYLVTDAKDRASSGRLRLGGEAGPGRDESRKCGRSAIEFSHVAGICLTGESRCTVDVAGRWSTDAFKRRCLRPS